MRNLARAVSKIRRTIEPLFVLSDRARLYVARPVWSFTYAARRMHVRVLLHTPGHTFVHIMPPFMPCTCAEQLHFKITDFAARFVRKHARDKSALPTRVAVADTNPKFLHHTLCRTFRLHWQHQFYPARPINSLHPPFYKKCVAPKRTQRFEL